MCLRQKLQGYISTLLEARVQGQGWHAAFLSSLTLLLSCAPSPRVSSPTGEATHVPTSYLLGEAFQEK